LPVFVVLALMEFRGLDGVNLTMELLALQPDTTRKSLTSSHELSTAASSCSDIAAFTATHGSDALDEQPSYASESSCASFEEQYEILEDVLGTGANGSVRRGVNRETGKRVAVKSYVKHGMRHKDLESLRCEVAILSHTVHPNVVRLEDVYETEEMTHIIMEELEGGEIWEHLCARRRFREREAAEVAVQCLVALAFLHKQGVAHRDIKPENLLYSQKSGGNVKLIDFGFAAEVGNGLTAQCGTLGYVAPEVFSAGSYDEQCDMWSMGSLLYLLLTGQPLFKGSEEEIFVQTRSFSEPEFSMEFWCLYEDAQDLLRALLHVNPAQRPSAQEALGYPWFLRVVPSLAAAATGSLSEP